MVSLALETAMVASFAGTKSHAGNAMGVFFTFCFISFYGGGCDATSYVYCSKLFPDAFERETRLLTITPGEIFPTHIRSQGMAWSIVGTFLSTVIYVEAGPTALTRIQWKYYLIFVILTLVNIIIIWRWCPEVCHRSTSCCWRLRLEVRRWELTFQPPQTKGLSLEEINGRFGDEVVVHFADATEKQRANLEASVLAEGTEGRTRNHAAGVDRNAT